MNWNPDPSQLYLTRREAQRLLGRSEGWFSSRIASGAIRAGTRGGLLLYPPSSVLALRAASSTGGADSPPAAPPVSPVPSLLHGSGPVLDAAP